MDFYGRLRGGTAVILKSVQEKVYKYTITFTVKVKVEDKKYGSVSMEVLQLKYPYQSTKGYHGWFFGMVNTNKKGPFPANKEGSRKMVEEHYRGNGHRKVPLWIGPTRIRVYKERQKEVAPNAGS